MLSTRSKCAVILIISLIQGEAFASLNNGYASTGNSFGSFFTNLPKVPWIYGNVNDSREAASLCRDDIARVFEGAINSERWALQMVDATSGLPSGILRGNIHDLGMYDECVEVVPESNPSKIQGQHCMISLSLATEPNEYVTDLLHMHKMSPFNPTPGVSLTFTSSVCLPSSCGIGEIGRIMNSTVAADPRLTDMEIRVARVTCSPVGFQEFTLGEMLTVGFIGFLVIFLVISTICDFIQRSRNNDTSMTLNILAEFSLRKNMKTLLSTKSRYSSLTALSGIRFLCMCLVVLGHRSFCIILVPRMNIADLQTWFQSPGAVFVFMSFYVTEVFFVLGGFLRSYFFLTIVGSGKKFNIVADYLHRYIRITPGVAVMTLFSVFIFHRLGSGPLWETIIGLVTNSARENWWANILYVQNFVNAEKMFLPHFWYLAVDMQLFWMSPIILYPLDRWPKLGLVILGSLFVASLIVPCVVLAVNEYSAIVDLQKDSSAVIQGFIKAYIPLYNRATNYLVGIYLGYDVVKNKRELTKSRVIINWILCCLTMILCSTLTYSVKPFAKEYNLVWELVYVVLARPAWGIATVWIIYACIRNHGGMLTKFLSLPVFVPLSRLAYSIYLVHFVIQALPAAAARSPAYATRYEIFHDFFGDLMVSIIAAVIMELFIYSPVIVIQNLVHSEQRRYISKLFPQKEGKANSNVGEPHNSPDSTTKC